MIDLLKSLGEGMGKRKRTRGGHNFDDVSYAAHSFLLYLTF